MNPYTISIDRQSRTWAVFDDNWKCVKDFVPYESTDAAIADGKAWVKERCEVEPNIVYPFIKKMQAWT